MGMRQLRTGPGTGDIYDCHSIEFEYADGTRYYCQARQQPGTWSHVSENVTGTKGQMTLGVGPWGAGEGHAADAPRQADGRRKTRTNSSTMLCWPAFSAAVPTAAKANTARPAA